MSVARYFGIYLGFTDTIFLVIKSYLNVSLFKVNLVKIKVYLKLNDLAKCHIYDRWPYSNVFLQLKLLNSMLSLPTERSISLFWNEFPQWILTVSFYVLPVRKELRFGVRRSVFNEREKKRSLKSLHPVRFPFSILCNFSSVGINLIRILIQRIFCCPRNHLPVLRFQLLRTKSECINRAMNSKKEVNDRNQEIWPQS